MVESFADQVAGQFNGASSEVNVQPVLERAGTIVGEVGHGRAKLDLQSKLVVSNSMLTELDVRGWLSWADDLDKFLRQSCSASH